MTDATDSTNEERMAAGSAPARPARTGALLVTAAVFTVGLALLAWPWIDGGLNGYEVVELVKVADASGRKHDVMVFIDPTRGVVLTRSLIKRTGLWPDGRRLVLWTRHGLWWRKSIGVCDAPRGKPVLIRGEGDKRDTIFVNAPIETLRSRLEVRDGLARVREPAFLGTLIKPQVPMRPPSVPNLITPELVDAIEGDLERRGMTEELEELRRARGRPGPAIR